MEVRNGKGSLTRLIAGIILVLVSILSIVHNPHWVIGAGAIGLTHITSATIGFCPLEKLLTRLLRMPVKGYD